MPATALRTDYGAYISSMAAIHGLSLVINRFVISDGGHDPADGSNVIIPGLDILTPPGVVLLDKLCTEVRLNTSLCLEWVCDIEPAEAVGENSALSLLGIVLGAFDPVTQVPTTHPLVGTSFLYAVHVHPLFNKTPTMPIQHIVGIRH